MLFLGDYHVFVSDVTGPVEVEVKIVVDREVVDVVGDRPSK